MARYYWHLRMVIREAPHLRPLVARCRHCRIRFLTHPRNVGRTDLGCPFGCRDVHRKINSSKRSTEYYRTKEGKLKKKWLNDRRRAPENSREKPQKQQGFILARTVFYHLQLVTSLIEGRSVAYKEILFLVEIILGLRQHGIDLGEKWFYPCFHRHKPPP